MRWLPLFALVVVVAHPSTVSAQANRYGDVSGSASPPVAELPFSNQDLSATFDQSDLGVRPPQTLVEEPTQTPPAETRPQPTPPAESRRPPERTYASSPPYSPPATTNAVAATQYAESLMRDALTPPAGSQLDGTRVYLSDVIRSASSRAEQSEAIGAYWDLCSAVADYYLSLHEQTELERLAARSGQASTPLREAAVDLATRRDTALTAARASQLRLAALIGRTGPPPLPGDIPLCAVYHTRYSQNFPDGDSQEAAELNKLLPLRHAELLGAAAAVGNQEDWFDRVARQATNDQGEGVVKALQFLALNRRAFVQIARDYNKRIARYTELARPGQLQTDRLVAMLIKTDAVASRSQPREIPNARTRSQAEPPTTFRPDAVPRLDSEILPAGAIEDHNMVEKIAPGESSVLKRIDGE